MAATPRPLRIGSFRGVPFRLGAYDFTGGRRNEWHEYPLRDIPLAEDLGRRGRKFSFQAHVIGDTWELQRNRLLTALEAEGPGLLLHPYLGQHNVLCDTFTVSEAEQRRIAQFTLAFLETAGYQFPTSTPNAIRVLARALAAAWDV
jgi:prophage DNA circulation protein